MMDVISPVCALSAGVATNADRWVDLARTRGDIHAQGRGVIARNMGCPFSIADRRTPVPRLSAIVITRNEAAKIADCLDSLAFCDERIVVDCGSEDETVSRALARGARVEHHVFEGFGAQKNFALSLASSEWVLSVDADERVSPALAAEITAAISEQSADGYEMPRSSSFLGRTMRHSGWSPDYVM